MRERYQEKLGNVERIANRLFLFFENIWEYIGNRKLYKYQLSRVGEWAWLGTSDGRDGGRIRGRVEGVGERRDGMCGVKYVNV